jgi:hypothetical protein
VQNTKKRIFAALIFTFLFTAIWIGFDIFVFLDINNENIAIAALLGLVFSIPFGLYASFLINNQYKIISEEVRALQVKYIINHFYVIIISVIISFKSDTILFFLSQISTIVVFLHSIYVAKNILRQTLNLHDVDENKKKLLLFSDANVYGGTCVILCFVLLPLIIMIGQGLLAILLSLFLLFLSCALNYLKLKQIKSSEILNFRKHFIINNISVLLSIIVANFLSRIIMEKIQISSFYCVIITVFFCIIIIIPVHKTNRIIALELKRLQAKLDKNFF